MTDKFEKIIRGAAPELVDIDSIRRTNRALMKNRAYNDQPRRQRKYRLGVVATSLAIVMLFTGQITDLGSEGWGLNSEIKTLADGREVKVHSREFGPGKILSSTITEEEAREYLIAGMAGEDVPYKISGIEIQGATHWIVHVHISIDGKLERSGRGPKDRPSNHSKNHEATFNDGFQRQIILAAKEIPPISTRLETVEGIPMQMQTWEFDHPEFGTIKYFLGKPIR